MDRRTAALAVREAFGQQGVIVIAHEVWGSIFNYSGSPDGSPINMNRYSVFHHTGSSALLSELTRYKERGYDPLRLGMDKMADIDSFHYWVRGYNRGFAYTGACLPWPIDGKLVWFEGRSAWVSHGAHLNDPGKNDWPTYYMIGAGDTAVSDAQKEFAHIQNKVLRSVFGFEATKDNQKKHREVQGFNTTQCCDPTLGAFLVEFRDKEYFMDLIETKGENRHGTLAEAALRHFTDALKVNIAAGDAYPDLVAATVAAAQEGVPVLSVNRTGHLPVETVAALASLGTVTVELFGGEAAVDASVRDKLRDL